MTTTVAELRANAQGARASQNSALAKILDECAETLELSERALEHMTESANEEGIRATKAEHEVRELRAANEQLANELAASRENHIDANKRNMAANKRAERAEAALEQARALLAELSACGYECEAGALENNQAYRELAALLAAAPGGAA